MVFDLTLSENNRPGSGRGITQRKNTMHTIILRHDGIDRHYPCENYYDAVVLFAALTHRYRFVEMWKGDELIQKTA